MVDFTISQNIHATPERFWEVFFDAEWTRHMIVDGLGFTECRIDDSDETETHIKRHMFVIPKLVLPRPVIKVVGERFGYDEYGEYEKATKTWRWKIKLNVLSDKILMSGDMRMEPLGTDRCRRVSDIRAQVKIFGVGKLIEMAAEKSLRDGWTDSAHWINGWLARNPKSADPAPE